MTTGNPCTIHVHVLARELVRGNPSRQNNCHSKRVQRRFDFTHPPSILLLPSPNHGHFDNGIKKNYKTWQRKKQEKSSCDKKSRWKDFAFFHACHQIAFLPTACADRKKSNAKKTSKHRFRDSFSRQPFPDNTNTCSLFRNNCAIRYATTTE